MSFFYTFTYHHSVCFVQSLDHIVNADKSDLSGSTTPGLPSYGSIPGTTLLPDTRYDLIEPDYNISTYPSPVDTSPEQTDTEGYSTLNAFGIRRNPFHRERLFAPQQNSTPNQNSIGAKFRNESDDTYDHLFASKSKSVLGSRFLGENDKNINGSSNTNHNRDESVYDSDGQPGKFHSIIRNKHAESESKNEATTSCATETSHAKGILKSTGENEVVEKDVSKISSVKSNNFYDAVQHLRHVEQDESASFEDIYTRFTAENAFYDAYESDYEDINYSRQIAEKVKSASMDNSIRVEINNEDAHSSEIDLSSSESEYEDYADYYFQNSCSSVEIKFDKEQEITAEPSEGKQHKSDQKRNNRSSANRTSASSNSSKVAAKHQNGKIALNCNKTIMKHSNNTESIQSEPRLLRSGRTKMYSNGRTPTHSSNQTASNVYICRSILDMPHGKTRRRKYQVYDIGPKQAIKSRFFWTMWFMSSFSNSGGPLFVGLWKAYGETFIANDHFLTLLALVSSLCNAGGRVFWGLLADRYDPRVSNQVYWIVKL